MLSQNLIKEASVLRKQLQSGTIVLPAIDSFLAKVELNAPLKGKAKSKEDRVNEMILRLDSRKRSNR